MGANFFYSVFQNRLCDTAKKKSAATCLTQIWRNTRATSRCAKIAGKAMQLKVSSQALGKMAISRATGNADIVGITTPTRWVSEVIWKCYILVFKKTGLPQVIEIPEESTTRRFYKEVADRKKAEMLVPKCQRGSGSVTSATKYVIGFTKE